MIADAEAGDDADTDASFYLQLKLESQYWNEKQDVVKMKGVVVDCFQIQAKHVDTSHNL